MNRSTAWRSAPLWTRLVFLLAVFFIFASFGFVNDVLDMGNEPDVRFVLSVLVFGGFAVAYAASGVVLRSRLWKVFIPLMTVQIFCNVWLGSRFPDGPEPIHWTAVQIALLHNRMTFDGVSVILFVCAGYAGFVWVSISEARRHMKAEAGKARLEIEMNAAREIQRIMVPEQLPAIPGYQIESTYRPAAEVGGDFFQVIPLVSGRTLVVIGDVSGKGLRAAMIVSMIVGMLRSTAAFTELPGELMAELNRSLCGRTDGGFATCVIVRLDEDGQLMIANAGHPSPYINGVELPFTGSVPLGLVQEVMYAQTTYTMQPCDVAVLLTDGVAEAQDAQHVLLGFSRVESLLRDGADANAVADIAQQHGQRDDLTVIRIARQANADLTPEPALAS